MTKSVSNAAKVAADRAAKAANDAAKAAADAAKAAADAINSAIRAVERTANDGVKAVTNLVEDMTDGLSSHDMDKLIHVAASCVDVTGGLVGGILDSEELQASLVQETERTKSGELCFSAKVPNFAKMKFNIKNLNKLITIPDTTIRQCAPDFMEAAKALLGINMILPMAKSVIKAFENGGDGWTESSFVATDSMFVGPGCSGRTYGIQFTASLGGGAASGAGGGIAVEVGFQVGCMKDIPGHGTRFVIVPMWGFGAAVSAGYASPSVGIDANVYLYMPFGYYSSFGHELSIGAEVGIGENGGVSADVIFGCCTDPLKSGGVPLDITTKTVGVPGTSIKFKFPTSPFVKIALAGGHVGVSLSSKDLASQKFKLSRSNAMRNARLGRTGNIGGGLTDASVKLIQPSSGREIKTRKNPKTGRYEMLQERTAPVTLLQDDSKEKSKGKSKEGGDLTINIGYARACRKFDASAAACFSQFNP